MPCYIRTLRVFVVVFLLLPHVESAQKFTWSTKLHIPLRFIQHPACFVSLDFVFIRIFQVAYSLCIRMAGILKVKYEIKI